MHRANHVSPYKVPRLCGGLRGLLTAVLPARDLNHEYCGCLELHAYLDMTSYVLSFWQHLLSEQPLDL